MKLSLQKMQLQVPVGPFSWVALGIRLGMNHRVTMTHYRRLPVNYAEDHDFQSRYTASLDITVPDPTIRLKRLRFRLKLVLNRLAAAAGTGRGP